MRMDKRRVDLALLIFSIEDMNVTEFEGFIQTLKKFITKTNDRTIAKMNAKIDGVQGEIAAKIDGVNAKVDGVNAEIQAKIDKILEQLNTK